MSVLTAIWAASIVAAVFFMVAGYFVARARMSQESAARRRDVESQRAELALAESRAKHHEEVADAARADAERTAQELARTAEAEQRARRLVDEQQRSGEEQKNELSRLRREIDQLARARGELARTEKELAASKSKASRLETRGTEGEVLATKKIVELAAVVSTLRAELDAETKRAAVLAADNERIRALGVGHKSQFPKNAANGPEGTDIASAPASGLDGRSLQRFVDDVARSPTISAAALTDELGFLVAGNGEHTEALAAFGAYLTEAGARATGLLPMHVVQRVSVQDDWGITLTARTVASAPNELVLVTLGV
ncbi:MAG TPA: hypothetical protein VNO21_14145, partial [Polyangiaceae bacterium]|nr:hypothetical protein [Polyangiaceae bacterium]